MPVMRTIIRSFLALFVVWGLWVAYQARTRYPVAERIAQERVDELGNTDLSSLSQQLGTGYKTEEKLVDGISYMIGLRIAREEKAANASPSQDLGSNDHREAQQLRKKARILGFVKCVRLVPFTAPTIGPKFQLDLEETKSRTVNW
jgi:hypothetical protein